MAIDYKGKMFYSMSQAKFNELRATNGGKLPSEYANSYIMTDAEDVNLSQMRTKVLWTLDEDLLTTNFSPQEVTIEDDGYVFLEIRYRYSTAHNIERSDTIRAIAGTKGLLTFVNTPDYIYRRPFTLTTRSVITFAQGFQGTGTTETTHNGVCIPISVTGIYKSPAMIYTGAELHEGDDISIKDGVVSVKRNIIELHHQAADQSYSANTQHFPTLSVKGVVGNKLTLSDNGVLIGKGVKKVKISAYFNYWANSSAGKTVLYLTHINKDGSFIRSFENYIPSSVSTMTSFADTIYEVTEGDLFKLSFSCNVSGYLWAGAERFTLTVEVIE